MKLFAELYLDEDVSVLVAALLRARRFSATTARDEGMLRQSDANASLEPLNSSDAFSRTTESTMNSCIRITYCPSANTVESLLPPAGTLTNLYGDSPCS